MNNENGSFEYITSAYVVAGAKMNLGIKHSTEDDLYLEDMLNEGVKQLRNLQTFVPAIATLPIEGGKAKLPLGFVRFNKGDFPIRFVESNGQIDTSTSIFTAPVFGNNSFFTDSPFADFAGYLPYTGAVNLSNGYLWLEGTIPNQFLKIAYLSVNVDEAGNILIPAIAERALKAYMCWKYSSVYFKNYPQDIRIGWEREWKFGKKHLKGLAAMNQSFEQPYIDYVINKLP